MKWKLLFYFKSRFTWVQFGQTEGIQMKEEVTAGEWFKNGFRNIQSRRTCSDHLNIFKIIDQEFQEKTGILYALHFVNHYQFIVANYAC